LWQNYVTTKPNGWSEPRPLGGTAKDNFCLRWAASGNQLLLSLDNRLVVIGVDVGSRRTLLDMRGDGESPLHCAWGRDGRLYFNTLSAMGRYSFWSVAATGSAPRLILRDTPQRRVARWDFDTDGRRLFFSVRADESDIWAREIRR
jgi:hypothetical protein